MSVMINRYPLWKYLLIIFVIAAGFLYAAPNIYGTDPAVQIMGQNNTLVDQAVLEKTRAALQKTGIPYANIAFQDQTLLVRFTSSDLQMRAKEVIQEALGNDYIAALNLSPATPSWFNMFGAVPMKLGLDLRGGVHFLMQVDVDSVVKQRVEGELRTIGQTLREERIRYMSLNRQQDDRVNLIFRDQASLQNAYSVVMRRYPDFTWEKKIENNQFILDGLMSPQSLFAARKEILEQTMNTLRNRVNELGVSEAIVQQQGESRISIDLPGIQDTAEAKNLLGKTATLEFHMVDVDHDASLAASQGITPPDTRLYAYRGGHYLLKNQIVLRGSSIVSATAGTDDNDARPNVSVRLNGTGDNLFTKVTAENIGKPMAALFVEVHSSQTTDSAGKKTITYKTERKIISVATIQSALGNHFQITGLNGVNEARTLALLLRAGALPASVTFIEERQVGPSLGQHNIKMGWMSVTVGMGLVVVFMAVYYGLMGILADIALILNLVLIVALLSLLGATLTLPGIAGIVLTMGMAVDANVLIFERIREEIRRGVAVQASIHAGYERAFITIFDANVTTLIVMLILFGLGSGVIKGIAITVTIGVLTSMFTAITGTRALVNLIYGGRALKHISIGI